jgi:hypothetical protein
MVDLSCVECPKCKLPAIMLSPGPSGFETPERVKLQTCPIICPSGHTEWVAHNPGQLSESMRIQGIIELDVKPAVRVTVDGRDVPIRFVSRC